MTWLRRLVDRCVRVPFVMCIGGTCALMLLPAVGGAEPVLSAERSTSSPSSWEENPDDWTPVVDAIPGVIGRIETALGDRYASSWLDHASVPSVLRVGVVAPTAADRAALDALTGDFRDRFHIAEASRSKRQLDAFLRIAEEEVGARAPEAVSLLSIEPRSGGILVEVGGHIPGLREAIISRGVPEGALTFGEALSLTPIHGARNVFPPYEGALEVNGSWGACTSGFTAKTAVNFQGLTAGHCGPSGAAVNIGSTFVSNVNTRSYTDGATADVERFYLSDSEAMPRLMKDTNVHRLVKSPRFTLSDTPVDTHLCYLGKESGPNHCGYVKYIGPATDTSGITINPSYCMDGPQAQGGDSGAPVFSIRADESAKPAGMAHTIGRLSDETEVTCFSHISAILGVMNVTLDYAN